MYRVELRIVRVESGVTVTGVSSKPFDHERLNSEAIFRDIGNHALTLVGYARQEGSAADPVTPPYPPSDRDAVYNLRHYADLMEQGKYVCTVIKRTRGDQQEFYLLLDPKKS